MRATHWIAATDPELAQAIASIVLNFGALEWQLGELLHDLQDCAPNERTAPKNSLSDTLKAIRHAAETAFGPSKLARVLVSLVDRADSLSQRRNILIHGMMVASSNGGLVIAHLRNRPRERTIYEVSVGDAVALDNEITLANLELEFFRFGISDDRVPASKDYPTLAAQMRNALSPSGPRGRIPLKKEPFPSG